MVQYIVSRYGSVCLALVLIFAATGRGAPVQFDGPVNDIDGRLGPQYSGMGSRDVQLHYRPLAADETTLDLRNLRIHDVDSQKAIDIGVTTNPDGSLYYYKNISVNHYEGYNIGRDLAKWGALHVDFLRIAGGGNHQPSPTNVTLNDLYLHDGNALPIIIQDGWFGTVVLKDIRIENTTLNVQLATMHTGRIDHIIVEDSPGLHVLTQNQPGNIPLVDIINSPGAVVGGTPIQLGGSSATISGSNEVPEPASLLLLVPGAVFIALRRRR